MYHTCFFCRASVSYREKEEEIMEEEGEEEEEEGEG